MISIGSFPLTEARQIAARFMLSLVIAAAPRVCPAEETPTAATGSTPTLAASAADLRLAARSAFAAADPERGRRHLQSLLALYRESDGKPRSWRERYQWSRRLAELAHEHLRAGTIDDAMAVLGEAADLDVPLREGFDNGLASAAGGWHRQLAQLDANQRYEVLRAWSMPAPSGQRVRVLQAFVPDQAPPSVFARALGERAKDTSFPIASVGEVPGLFSSAWELVQAANDTGRLRQLTAELEKLAEQRVANAEHLLTLARIAATDRRDAHLATELNESLRRLATGASTRAGSRSYEQAWQYGHGTLDDEGAVAGFTPFPVWSGAAWQTTRNRPDPTLRFVRLDRSGGHTGPATACIRRWTAPVAGVVSVSGTLQHPIGIGDGVRARVIASRGGVAGQWTAFNSTAETNIDKIAVGAGDTIDFVVDMIENTTYDAFIWLFQLRLKASETELIFDSFDDFCGPRETHLLEHAVIAAACLRRDELQPIGQSIFQTLIENTSDADTWMNRPTDSDSPLLRPMLRRAWAVAVRGRQGDFDPSWIDRTGLDHWIAAGGRTATQHARGQTRQAWLAHEDHLLHLAGSGNDSLLLKYPLNGTFQFSVETQAGGRPSTDGGVVYGGLGYLLDGCDRLLRLTDNASEQELTRPCPNVRVQARRGDPYVVHPLFNRLTLTVASAGTTMGLNGQAIWSDSSNGNTAPWLALKAQGDHMPMFRGLLIIGDPVVPREVRMSDGDSLRGWSASYYGDRLLATAWAGGSGQEYAAPRISNANHAVPDVLARRISDTAPSDGARVGGAAIGTDGMPSEHDWFAEEGVIHGLRRQAADAAIAQSRLSYVRPLLDGESISYEFFYEPGKYEVHPALGRLAFLIEAEGVRLHWMTDGKREWTGLAEDNALVEPFDRRGPKPLPLAKADWNRLTIASAGETVTLSLNDRLIYQRKLDASADRSFGFYHDACRTAAQVKNVVMRGDWPERLATAQLDHLAGVSVERSSADRRALDELFPETYMTEHVLQVARDAAGLPDEQRYAYLAEWVLPNDDHATIRMAGRFEALVTPPRDQQPLGVGSPLVLSAGGSGRLQPAARLVAPAIQLVEVAERLGRLDDIRGRLAAVPPAPASSPRPAMLALVALATGDFAAVNKHLGELVELNKSNNQAEPFDRWPEMLAVWTALRHAQTSETARELIELLNERVRAGTLGESDAWKHHLATLSAATRFQGELKEFGEALLVEPLQQWDVVSHVSARSRSQGFPASRWVRLPYRVENVVAHNRDYLYFQSPLRGNFQVECDVSSTFYRRESSLAYGGWWAQLEGLSYYGMGGYRMPPSARDTTQFEPRLTDPGPWMRYRIAVQDGQMKVYFSGRLLHEREVAKDCDPWLAMRTHWERNGGIRDVRITGQPIIPKQIELASGEALLGWLPYFDEPIGNDGWQFIDGELLGSAVGQVFNLSSQDGILSHESERLLHYHRPMLEDGTIEYDFYYEPGKCEVHPALDRLALLLEPAGIREHWATHGEFDETGLDPANASGQPQHRRGPDRLPLVASDWNQVRLTLTGDTVAIALNGQLVYERPLEPTNLRNFGLFHYADGTSVRARNIVWRGDWRRELPALSRQELADVAVVESLAEKLPQMQQVIDIDFAKQGPPRDLLGVSISDRANKDLFAEARSDGLHVSCPGPNRPDRNYYVLAPLFEFGGDFDITASYEGLETTVVNQPGTLCAVWLLLRFKNEREDHVGLIRKQYPHGDHSIESIHSWGPSDAKRLAVKGGRHDGNSGVLRMSHRGDKLYALLAEDEAGPFRVFGVFDVGPGTIPAGDLNLMVESYDQAATKITWKRLTVRAERLDRESTKVLAATLTPPQPTPPARFVRIDLPNKIGILSLAEVEVISDDKNVALKKKASQSSVGWNGSANLAVDGDRSGQFFLSQSTTHTTMERAPWWEVDLGQANEIDRVLVWNRSDYGLERLEGFRVQLLDEERNLLWEQSPELLDGAKVRLNSD